jgi:Cu-processing system ATP-binding protein
MIQIRGVQKRFGRLPVLRGIDLTVERGRVTALVGPNAAGKTTLIKCVLGLVRPDAGTLTFGGEPIGDGSAYRARIGVMPQTASFPENLSAAELLRMLRDLRGSGVETDEELIDEFALGPMLDRPLKTLSGGTRQKVSAVIAFLFRPELLILDEPTAGLDPVSSSVLKDKIVRERERGATFILTSHIMSELEELSDDVAFLLEGRIQYAGPAGALKTRSNQASLERALAWMMRGEVAA